MKKYIVGRNIKFGQVFIIIINIVSPVLLLMNAPLFLLVIDLVPLMFLYLNLNLYSISTEGEYFILESLFQKHIIKKDQCIGIATASKLTETMIIEFKNNKAFRFQLDSYSIFQTMFTFGGKTAEDDIFDKIQAFIDSSPEIIQKFQN